MKNIIFTFCVCLLSIGVSAQKFAYVNTDYILDNVPEFKKAQEDLNKLSLEWQGQIEAKYKEIDQLVKAYQADIVVLTDDMRKRRQDEITEKEMLAKEFQTAKFGIDGELFKKRQELVKPIQDKVYNAIKEVATSSQLSIIFDKAGDQANMLYADPNLDKSDTVLRKMGIKK